MNEIILCKCGSLMEPDQSNKFYKCKRYPLCMEILNTSNSVLCPYCNEEMRKVSGKFGDFYSCKNYFKTGCKGTRKISDVKVYELPKKVNKSTYTDIPTDDSNIELIETNKFPYTKFKFEFFNQVQSKVFQLYDKDINIVIASATSSGKTTMAEMFISDTKHKGKKSVFLSPLKAISQEKYDEWTTNFSNYNVSIVTGDYSLTPDRIEELNKADLIIMTNEMFDSRTRKIKTEKNDWLLEVGTIIVDEAHILCMPGRGDKIESSIMRFSEQNKNSRIVFLSATMPNVSEIAQWLSSLNSKKTELINSNYRPCKLDVHYEDYDDKEKYSVVEHNKIKKTLNILLRYPTDKFLVFVHSIKTGKLINDELKQLNERSEIFNSELTSAKRKEITKKFKDDLRIIVTTSALAWGVNLPSRRVIIVGIHRGINEIEPLDIRQMIGRSGRVGLDPKGDAYILLPKSKFQHYKNWCENLPPITSTFNNDDILAFHVISEISNNVVYDYKSLMKWYNRSLAAFQKDFLTEDTAKGLLKKLETFKIIKIEDEKINITQLGKIASHLYFSPYTVSSWYFNFNNIFKNNIINDISISWALANTIENSHNYVIKDIEEQIKKFGKLCNSQQLKIPEGCTVIGTLYYSCLEYDNSIRENIKYSIKYDFERIIIALKMIDETFAFWNKKNFFDRLEIRIKYEITEKQTELYKVKDSKIIRKLYDAGIFTIAKLKTEKKLAIKTIGEEKYEQIIYNIKNGQK